MAQCSTRRFHIILTHCASNYVKSPGDSRSLSGEGPVDAEDLEVAELRLAESGAPGQSDNVKFDLTVVEDAERLNVLVSASDFTDIKILGAHYFLMFSCLKASYIIT